MAQNLIEKIDELRANSVTDEQFKKMWGKSIDEHLEELMEKIKAAKAAK